MAQKVKTGTPHMSERARVNSNIITEQELNDNMPHLLERHPIKNNIETDVDFVFHRDDRDIYFENNIAIFNQTANKAHYLDRIPISSIMKIKNIFRLNYIHYYRLYRWDFKNPDLSSPNVESNLYLLSELDNKKMIDMDETVA